jgi:hypothetical protein
VRALQDGRRTAGAPDLAVHAAQALSRLESDTRIRDESRALNQVVGNPAEGREIDAWAIASTAWAESTAAGADAHASRQAMVSVIEECFVPLAVRDVSALPADATVASAGFRNPAAWARAEFAAVRARIVTGWARELNQALITAATEATSTTDYLLLISQWPIVDDQDAALALPISINILKSSRSTPQRRRFDRCRAWRYPPAPPGTSCRLSCCWYRASRPNTPSRRARPCTGVHRSPSSLPPPDGKHDAVRAAAIAPARTAFLYFDDDAATDHPINPQFALLSSAGSNGHASSTIRRGSHSASSLTNFRTNARGCGAKAVPGGYRATGARSPTRTA